MPNVFEGKPDARQSDDAAHVVSRFRPTYRALTDQEKLLHDQIKTKAEELNLLFVGIAVEQPRYVALAQTSLEQAVMWAVKGLTS